MLAVVLVMAVVSLSFTAEWLGHRRWCVLMGGWPGWPPRPMNLVS